MGQNMHLARYPIHWHIVGDGPGPVHRELLDPRHLQPLRDGARHQRRAGREQRHLQHRRPLLLPRRRGSSTATSSSTTSRILTKCHPDGKPCVPTNLGADGSGAAARISSWPARTAKRHPDPVGQHGVVLLDHQSGQHLHRQRGRRVRGDRLLAGHARSTRTGAFLDSAGSKNIWPRRTPLREFRGNTAHSNFDGFMFDRGPRPDGTLRRRRRRPYGPRQSRRPEEPGGGDGTSTNLTSYKNRNGGLWARGEMDIFSNLKMADNAIGYDARVRRCRQRRLHLAGGRFAVRRRERQYRQSRRRRRKSPTAAACRSRKSPTSRSAATNSTITAHRRG